MLQIFQKLNKAYRFPAPAIGNFNTKYYGCYNKFSVNICLINELIVSPCSAAFCFIKAYKFSSVCVKSISQRFTFATYFFLAFLLASVTILTSLLKLFS